jgi:flagellar L-ring protein FlgH
MRTAQSKQTKHRPPRTDCRTAGQLASSVAVATCLMLILSIQVYAQSEFKGNVASLFTDERSYKVGDVITVEINERLQGQNNAQFRSQRGSDVSVDFGAGPGKVFGLLNPFSGEASSQNDFDSRVQNNKLTSFTTQISTRVIRTDELGNLYLEGSKVINLPDEQQVVLISGVARSRDITQQNSIQSTQLADLHVDLKGKGEAEDARRPSLFTRVFQWFF